VDRNIAQRFILQMLVALFAEDIGLLNKYFVVRLLDECTTPAETFDLIGGLFEAMNTPSAAAGGRFKGVAYSGNRRMHYNLTRWRSPQKGTKGAKRFSFCAFCASLRLKILCSILRPDQ
jgi:hypothetical protein